MDEWKAGYTWAILGGLFAILALILSIVIMPAGHVGVITRFGAVERVAYPGLSFKIPFIEGVVKMDVRTLKDEVDTSAASKDLQLITATIAVNYHLDGKSAVTVYQDVGTKYADILIAPAIQNIFKATTAQYTAEELITKRNEVRVVAEKALTEQLSVYHVVVENFNIVNFDFSPEFNAAIEAKQVAQQQVETAKQKLAQAQIDAQTVIAQAQGQADAQAALKNTGALSPEYLQYLALTKWNGVLPLVTGGTTPFVDVSGYIQNPNPTVH
jgi:regulator of protease activity HflC (stomatin/prohibitin superfamily)